MERAEEILRFVKSGAEGIEIGPFTNPLIPKAKGFNTTNLDVFPKDRLVAIAENDANVRDNVERIEDVELIGPAQNIFPLVSTRFGEKKFDHIISSHNIEHIPDPIRFLQGCAAVLKPGGYLSLAIPDHRCCFDAFLPITTLADWLEAYFEERIKPTPKQIFLRDYLRAEMALSDGSKVSSFELATDIQKIELLTKDISPSFKLWEQLNSNPGHDYIDAHCWMFTPESFELTILDCQKLQLVPLEIERINGPSGNEFYAHLRAIEPSQKDYEKRRLDLARKSAVSSRNLQKPVGKAKAWQWPYSRSEND